MPYVVSLGLVRIGFVSDVAASGMKRSSCSVKFLYDE